MKLFRALLIVGLLSMLSACGYGFQGGGSVLPPDIKTVAIPRAENDTTYNGVDLQFTEALRSSFERYGVVNVVDREDRADAILDSRIVSIQTRTGSVTGRTDIELEQELIMTISASLKRRSGQLLWRDPQLMVRQSVASTSDVVVTSSSDFATGGIGAGTLGGLGSRELSRGQQDEALEDLVEEAARRVYLDAVAADF